MGGEHHLHRARVALLVAIEHLHQLDHAVTRDYLCWAFLDSEPELVHDLLLLGFRGAAGVFGEIFVLHVNQSEAVNGGLL